MAEPVLVEPSHKLAPEEVPAATQEPDQPWWCGHMTIELKQLLYLDDRCFFCRQKCDSTNPRHDHYSCPVARERQQQREHKEAKKRERKRLLDKLAYLNKYHGEQPSSKRARS